jgi:hypothetical protein
MAIGTYSFDDSNNRKWAPSMGLLPKGGRREAPGKPLGRFSAKGFRRLKAYKHLPVLRAALAAHQSKGYRMTSELASETYVTSTS